MTKKRKCGSREGSHTTSTKSVQTFLTSIKDKIGFLTHSLPAQKNLKIVIKGLPLDLTNEEIFEELTNLDQNPIILLISESITTLSPLKARKRINWKKYEKYLSENLSKINNIKSTNDVDKKIPTLTKTIQSALEIYSYTIKHFPRKEQLTSEIQLEISQKLLLRKE
ncbi:hypothetical protein ACI65C_009712 [Semiaphis heraclei]